MSHIVTENCIQCKFTSCVNVCPVSAFHEGKNFLVINPEECIDCGLCVDECKANAIFSEETLPEEYRYFIDINKQYSQNLPVLLATKDPLQDAHEWLGKNDKFAMLQAN